MLAKALKRIANVNLSQAFDWWHHQADALRIARAKASQIICRMQRGSLASAFNSWSGAVLASEQAATQREQLVTATLAKSKTLLLARGFAVRLRHTLVAVRWHELVCFPSCCQD